MATQKRPEYVCVFVCMYVCHNVCVCIEINLLCVFKMPAKSNSTESTPQNHPHIRQMNAHILHVLHVSNQTRSIMHKAQPSCTYGGRKKLLQPLYTRIHLRHKMPALVDIFSAIIEMFHIDVCIFPHSSHSHDNKNSAIPL